MSDRSECARRPERLPPSLKAPGALFAFRGAAAMIPTHLNRRRTELSRLETSLAEARRHSDVDLRRRRVA